MVWGRARTREQEIDAFSAWLDEAIAVAPPKAPEEYLLDMLTAPDFGGVSRHVREIIVALPAGSEVSTATVIRVIGQIERELASKRFSVVAEQVKRRLGGSATGASG